VSKRIRRFSVGGFGEFETPEGKWVRAADHIAAMKALNRPFSQEEWNGKYKVMGPAMTRSRETVNQLLLDREENK
jgi:hypothetical protein